MRVSHARCTQTRASPTSWMYLYLDGDCSQLYNSRKKQHPADAICFIDRHYWPVHRSGCVSATRVHVVSKYLLWMQWATTKTSAPAAVGKTSVKRGWPELSTEQCACNLCTAASMQLEYPRYTLYTVHGWPEQAFTPFCKVDGGSEGSSYLFSTHFHALLGVKPLSLRYSTIPRYLCTSLEALTSASATDSGSGTRGSQVVGT